MKTFENWLQNRNIPENFDRLCEAIALSGIPYDLFWQEHAEPVLVKLMHSENITESMLLQQLEDTVGYTGPAYGAGHERIFGSPASSAPAAPAPLSRSEKARQTTAMKKEKSARFMQNNEKLINQVKQRLINSLENFKHTIVQSTQQKNPDLSHDDPLHQKFFMIVSSLVSNMQKQAQNWKPQAVIGKKAPDWQAKHQSFLNQQRAANVAPTT